MNCKLNKNLLYSYVDNTIEPLEKIFVEEHLNYCKECRKDLKLISAIDENLNCEDEDFVFPKRLNLISKLIVENGLAELEYKDLKLKLKNIIHSYEHFNKSMKNSKNIYKQNPFKKFIKKELNTSISIAKKPAKKFLKEKIKKISFSKIFKAS